MGLNAQVTELRGAFDSLQSEVDAAAQRVLDKLASMEARIVSLGEEDPDLQADIDEVKSEVEKLKGIAAEAAPEEPTEPDIEPTEPA
jgi:peptidoglycan hydrolase CwlO-like protein